MTNLILTLYECEKALQENLVTLDEAISKLGAALPETRNSRAVSVLAEDREQLRIKLQFVERTIHDAEKLEIGKQVGLAAAESAWPYRSPAPRQYEGMKLSTAAQAYLSERGRGPVLIAKAVEDLNFAGVLVGKQRARINTQHMRLLCSNNRVRFQYDREKDTISLRPTPGNDTGRSACKNSLRTASPGPVSCTAVPQPTTPGD